MQKLSSNIYVETSFPGVNVGAIITKEGVICIDTPTHPADAHKWRQKIAETSEGPLLFVINTDHHRDRVICNQWFDVPVIGHHFTAERLRLYPDLIKSGASDSRSDFEPSRDQMGVRIIAPQITFTQELTLTKGDHTINLQHKGGASPGAIWVLIPKAGVVFTGDSVVTHSHPYVGEANLEQWLANLDELQKAKFPAKTIVPGRGKLTDKKGLRHSQRYLLSVQRKMDALLKNRKGSRAMVSGIAAELVKQFPVPDTQRESVTRRLRSELERMYDARMGEM